MIELEERLRESLGRRETLLAELSSDTDCYRLLHGIAEGAPGVAIDRYGPVLLVQTWRHPLELSTVDACRQVAESALGASLVPVWNHRNKERGVPFSRFHAPDSLPEHPTGRELGLVYDVRPRHRGVDPLLFLDARVVRRRVKSAASGRSVLNLFAYTCSVGVAALSGGAREVWNVDFSRSALATGAGNAELNGFAPDAMTLVPDDVIPVVRQLAGLPVKQRRGRRHDFTKREPRSFDIVVLDPPRWSKGPFGAVDVVRDYPGVFKPALMATRKGGIVLATNHAPEVALDDWLRILDRTAEKFGRPLAGVEVLEPEADFPSFDGAPPLKVAWIETR